MPKPIEIVAQDSMDLFYQNYKSNSDFFELEDFISHCGGVLGAFYQQEYQRVRAEMRSERRDEVAPFDPGILLLQELEVKNEDGRVWADLQHSVMSFPFDEQGMGLQDILALDPRNGLAFERTTATAAFQLEYVPRAPIVWFYMIGDRIHLINKSTAKLKKINALTVPSVYSPKLMIPDGIVEYVVTTAAMTIKQGAQGTVVKKSSDQNPNKILQTEVNLPPSKP